MVAIAIVCSAISGALAYQQTWEGSCPGNNPASRSLGSLGYGTTVCYEGEWTPANTIGIGIYDGTYYEDFEGSSGYTEPQSVDIPWQGNWCLYIQNKNGTSIQFRIDYTIDYGK